MKVAIFVILAVLGTCYGYRVRPMELNPDDECVVPGELFPHPDCTKYFICDNFILKEQRCPLSTYFSPEQGFCVFPREVPECVGGTRPPTGSTTAAPPTSTTTEEPVTTTTEAETTEPATDATTGEPATTEAAPETTTEEEFITSEEPEQSTTEEEEATTEAEPEPSTTTEAEESTTVGICENDGTYTIAYPGNCSLYYLCANRVPVLRQCREGTFFDPNTGTCNLADLVPQCSVAFCGEDEVAYKPVPGNCTIYIICVFGEVSAGFCPEGTLFDPNFLECNVAENVNCTSDPLAFWDNKRVMNLLH